MKIIKERKITEAGVKITVDLNTDHEGLAEDMVKIIKKACSSAAIKEKSGMYYVDVDQSELETKFLQAFDFSRAEAKHGF